MNNKERSRNEAGKHTAVDRQGLIWESRAPQLSPPEKPRQRVIAAPALSPWLNLPGATSSTAPTLPGRPFQPSQWPSQPPAAFQEAPRPAAEHWPELFRGPAMRPAHPDADGLKPQTLEERHDRDAWPQGRMPRPETMEWRPDRDAWPQGKLPEIQTLEERHNRDAWPQGKMPDPRTLEGRSEMQGLTWEDLPKAPLFPTAADRATAEMVRQALLPGGKVPEGALLASTPLVRPAEAPPQATPPLWQGRLGADLSDKAEDITIHSRQGNGTYLTSVGGRAPQPLDEGDVAALTDLPAARLQALAAQSEKRSPAAAALLGAAPGAAAAALPPLAEPKASQQTATPGLPPAPVRPPAPVPQPPRLERTLQPVIGRDEPEEKLAAAGRWRVEDLPAFFQDPLLREATPPQRLQLLNDVLAQAGREYADRPGFGKQQYLDYQSVAAAARQQVQEMETWGEKAQGVGRFLLDVGTGALRSTIATAADTTMMEPDAALNPENPRFRMPLGNVAQQAGHWFDKAGDSADRAFSWGADQELDAGLADLQKDLATGNLPLGDRAAFNAWVDNYARRLSQAQAAWYEAVQGTGEKISHKGNDEVMDQAWLQTYARTNGLNAPHNAALLAEYLHTQDPAALDRLTESLKKTPQRARAERDQAQSLQDSSVVNFLTQSLDGGDYAQVMADAGNPLEIASNVVPILRGARAGAKAGGSTLGKLTSAAGSAAADMALEAANLAVENPDAHLADYLASGRDAIAAALGLHGTGMAIGAAAQAVDPALTRLAETAGEKAGTALAKRLHGDLPPGSPPAADPPPTSGPQAPLPDIPLAISEFNPQILQEAPGTSPTAEPPTQPTPAPPPLWQGIARHGEAAEVLRSNPDGTYQVRRNGGPEETFKESQVAAMTRMQKPELHAHMAQALQRQQRLEKIGSEQRLPADAVAPLPSFLRLADQDHGSNFGHERSGTERTYPKREDRDPGRALESLRQSASGQRSAGSGQTFGKTDRPRPNSPSYRLPELDAQSIENGIVSLERRKGEEHDVRFDPASNTVIKLTRPGEFGSEKLGLDGYLQRLAWANELFGDRIRVEGIVHLPGERSSRVVTTQPWYRADESRPQPTQREIDIYMRKKGFLKAYDGAYLHESRDIVASDAVPKNFVRDVEGHLHPVDVVLVEPSATQYERLENQVYNLPQISLDTP